MIPHRDSAAEILFTINSTCILSFSCSKEYRELCLRDSFIHHLILFRNSAISPASLISHTYISFLTSLDYKITAKGNKKHKMIIAL